MKLYEQQAPLNQTESVAQHTIENFSSKFVNKQEVIEDNEEDPMLTEGYLPEIYFTLRSDNPADW